MGVQVTVYICNRACSMFNEKQNIQREIYNFVCQPSKCGRNQKSTFCSGGGYGGGVVRGEGMGLGRYCLLNL